MPKHYGFGWSTPLVAYPWGQGCWRWLLMVRQVMGSIWS